MAKKAQGAFRTISEVADWLDIPAHVLRFWESKFNQIKPVKRAGGRRYYRPDDMLLIGGIKKLLHDDGLTIRGVQKMLKEEGVKEVSAQSQELDMPTDEEAARRRTARRARRKERAARAKAAKPPLVPETPPQEAEEPTRPKPALTIATPGQPQSPSPAPSDNVVQMPTREDPPSEPAEASEDPAAEDVPVAPIAETETAAASEDAAEESTQSAFELEDSSASGQSDEDTLDAAEIEDDAGDHVEQDASDTTTDTEEGDAPVPAAVPDAPNPAEITLSAKSQAHIEVLKALRRSDPDDISNKALIRTLHDRLSDLRARMGDG